MKCNYYIGGTLIGNIEDLNNFLLNEFDDLDSMSDVVFSKMSNINFSPDQRTVRTRIKFNAERALKITKSKEGSAIDGEAQELYEGDYIGLTQCLTTYRRKSDGSVITPNYERKSYWSNRLTAWDSAVRLRELDSLGNEVALGYTQEEIDLLVQLGAFTPDNIQPLKVDPAWIVDGVYDVDKLPKDSYQAKLIELVEKRWQHQAKLGTAIHAVFKNYFKEMPESSSFTYQYEMWEQSNPQKAKKAIEESIKYLQSPTYKDHKNEDYIDPSLLSADQIMQLIDMAKNLRIAIEDKFQDKDGRLMYFTETPFITQLGTTMPDQDEGDPYKYLRGRFDLAIADAKGNINIFDFKVGNKSYDKYDSAKTHTFDLQLGIENKAFENEGITKKTNSISDFIIPLELMDYKYNLVSDSFSFNDIQFNNEEGKPFVDITADVNSNSIQNVIEELIPTKENILPEDSELTSKITNITEFLFGIPPHKKQLSIQQIKNIVTQNGKKELKPNDNNYYVFELAEDIVIEQDASEDDAETKFLTKVQKTYTEVQGTLYKILQNVGKVIDNYDPETSDPLQEEKGLKRLGASNLALLSKYCTPSWSRLTSEQARQLEKLYNILIFVNESPDPLTGEKIIEVVKLSSNPTEMAYEGTTAERNNCNFQFASNKSEERKEDSLMLKAVCGNIDMLETLIVLNSLNLDSNGNGIKLNNIYVMNTVGQKHLALTARPEEFKYTLNTLYQQAITKNRELSSPIKEITEWETTGLKFNLGESLDRSKISFSSSIDQLLNLYNEAVLEDNRKYLDNYKESFEKIIEAEREQNLIETRKGLLNLLSLIESKYPTLKKDYINGQLQFANIETSNVVTMIYLAANKALLEVNGFKDRQQLKDHSDLLESARIWRDGLHNNQVDNPGNFGNQIVNDISKMIVNTTQQIRTSINEYTKENREDVQELDNALGRARASQFFTNPASRFKGMTYVSDNNDVLFINPWAKTPQSVIPKHFTEAEFNYLKKVILKINKLTHPTESQDLIIDKLSRNKDIDKYLQVPIVPPTLKSRVSSETFSDWFKNKFSYIMSPSKFWASLDRSLEGFKNNELSGSSSDDIIYRVTNIFSSNSNPARRKALIESLQDEFGKTGFYEINLELLLGLFQQAKLTEKSYANVMPVIRAATISLQQQSAISQTDNAFKTDLKTIENLVKSKVNNLSIIESKNLRKVAHVTAGVQKAASYLTLACSPVQATGQTLDGIVKLLKLSYAYKDSKNPPFTSESLRKAFALVSTAITDLNADTSLMEQFNITFGLNDMDLNSYVSNNMESKSIGLFNLDRLAFYLTSRPDFYNRLTLFIAQMMQEGVFEAYSLKNGRLEYDCTKDKRFKALWDSSASQAEKDEALQNYYAVALDLQQENVMYSDSTPFQITNKMPPAKLPKPYSNRQIESMKALGDNMYGYYDHAKKSLFQSTWAGGLIGQMKTYWSAKKNMYLGSEGVKNQGSWKKVMHPDQNNNKDVFLCFAKNADGSLDVNRRVWSNDPNASRIACMRWEGKFQEGIILTLRRIAFAENTPLFSRLLHPKKTLQEMCTENGVFNEDMYDACVVNLHLFISDLLALLLSYLLTKFFITPKVEETSKKAKDTERSSDRVEAASYNLLFRTIEYAASDSNAVVSIVGPLTDWQPFAFVKIKNFFDDGFKVITGDEQATDFLVKNTAPGKTLVKPWYKKEKEE